MKDQRILAQILLKKQEIKIITAYTLLLIGIGLTGYIHSLFKYDQYTYIGPESTVLPIPNVEFLLWKSNPKTFKLEFFRFHDIQAGKNIIQLYLYLKLEPNLRSEKEIEIKSQISIMKSGWQRSYAGSIVENEKVYINLTCHKTCYPQKLFEYKIPQYESDYMIAIEILNPAELSVQGVEAFTTGVLTMSTGFGLRIFLLQIVFYIISVIAFLLSLLFLENDRDPLYMRMFTLLALIANSQGYLLYPGRIRILIKEIILTTHMALLMNLWFNCVENILGKRYHKMKVVIIIIIAIPSFIMYHVLWSIPLMLGTLLLGLFSIFILLYHYKRFMKSLWDKKALFLIVTAYLICYLFILIRGDFDFLGNSEFNILFNMENSIFTMLIVIIHSLSHDRSFITWHNENSKRYEVVDVTTGEQSATQN